MSETRSTVDLWRDLSWLQGASADGGLVCSERVRLDELEPGNLVQHTYRRTCVDGSEIDESGWWMVDRVHPSSGPFGTLPAMYVIRLETGTADSRAFLDDERVEVRTDTRINVWTNV